MRDSFLFALDAVLSNRRRALLTVAIIAVGVASLVGIQTAVNVLADRVAGSFGKLGAGLYTLQACEDAPPLDGRQAAAFVAACDFAESATRWNVRSRKAVVHSGGVATDPVVRVLEADAGYVPCQGVKLAEGRNFTDRDLEYHEPVALIGDQIRRKLFGEESGLGREVTVLGARYRVVGVLERQGAVFGTGLDGSVICPPAAEMPACAVTIRLPARTAIGGGNAALAEAGRLMGAIRRLPPGARPDFEIARADSAMATLASLRSKLSLVALVIGLITMLGASVGLMNSLLVAVKERTREIGTRRALGARAKAIEGQFLMESVLIGQAGNVAGVLLGLAFGGLVAWGLDGSFHVPWRWLAAATLLSLAVSLASGLLPARRAAALDPVEALRSL